MSFKMATTSIWSVKGWLGKVVIYVQNPEKTIDPEISKLPEFSDMGEADIQGLSDVIAYAVNEEKTRQKNKSKNLSAAFTENVIENESETIMQQYVSGINCTPTTARSEMMAAKKRYGKEEGIMAFHGYQSFAPGECTPAMAHEIGLKLAEELWGDRFQVLVATHLDKAHHLHNHFVVNSVSFTDGLRYHRTNQDYRDMRNVSDRLCREYRLSVIEHPKPGKTKQYGEWQAEQDGKPTYRSTTKADVDDAIRKAKTEKQFFYYLKEKGYSIKFGKDVTIRMKGRDSGLKLARNFGEDYTLDAICQRILTQAQEKPMKQKVEQESQKKTYVVRMHDAGVWPAKRKIGGLRGLYFHYCYLLGIFPKNRPAPHPKQTHLLLREDLTRLNRISRETRLLCHYHIDTAEQLFLCKEKLQGQMEQLVVYRKHLRYKSRNIKEVETLSEVKGEIFSLTKQIGKLREEVVLCEGIAARSGVMKEKLQVVRQEKNQEKEEKGHEHIRRGR
ncbi:MAG: relaxase/mobilization nuclease domain-containing protein [Muricomes sp.]